MSSVRMCDKCNTVFSERSEGWGTGTFTQPVRDDNGNRRFDQVQMDICGECNAFSDSARPMIASIPTFPGVEKE